MAQDVIAESPYLIIKEANISRPGILSKVYGIFSKSQGVVLGYISWQSSWRQYAIKTEPNTVWNDECLDFISGFLKKLKEERKDK
jgi:hypothetical protein